LIAATYRILSAAVMRPRIKRFADRKKGGAFCSHVLDDKVFK
jgi:hypothetical protein